MFSYRVKVHAKTFLWGGDGVITPLETNTELALRVDEFGEPITLGYRKRGDETYYEIGLLRPGEVLSLQLEDLTAIRAEVDSPLDSAVDCMILPR